MPDISLAQIAGMMDCDWYILGTREQGGTDGVQAAGNRRRIKISGQAGLRACAVAVAGTPNSPNGRSRRLVSKVRRITDVSVKKKGWPTFVCWGHAGPTSSGQVVGLLWRCSPPSLPWFQPLSDPPRCPSSSPKPIATLPNSPNRGPGWLFVMASRRA